MWAEYLVFLAKVATIVVAIIIILLALIALIGKSKQKTRGKLQVEHVNKKYQEASKVLQAEILDKHELKRLHKQQKAEEKKREKDLKVERKKIFVVNFHGDIRAAAVSSLREEVTAILLVATPKDEVLVRLESAGGMVHGYGLAASQLRRIREKHIPLTVSIDKVAASGGYMMACVANQILAAPFAVIGSIGVIAQLPNFHRLLKRHDIEFEQVMAGEYKRTLTLFGENTKKGRQKLQEEVEDTHHLFKNFIVENRPVVAIDEVATGQHWFGQRALQLKLVDELITSDDYLLTASKYAEIYEVVYTTKKGLMSKMLTGVQSSVDKIFYNHPLS